MTGTRKCEKLPTHTSSRNENYNVIYELRQNVLLFPKTTRGDKSAFESGVDSVASCIFRVSSQAAKTYCLWNKFINNRAKKSDLAKLDADWKSVITFVAEWSFKVRIVRFGNWECAWILKLFPKHWTVPVLTGGFYGRGQWV